MFCTQISFQSWVKSFLTVSEIMHHDFLVWVDLPSDVFKIGPLAFEFGWNSFFDGVGFYIAFLQILQKKSINYIKNNWSLKVFLRELLFPSDNFRCTRNSGFIGKQFQLHLIFEMQMTVHSNISFFFKVQYPNQKLAGFVLCFKITNTFLPNNIQPINL